MSLVIPSGRRLETHRLDERIAVREVGLPISRRGESVTFLRALSMCSGIPASDLVVFSYFLCAVPLRLQNLFGVNRRVLYFVQENEPLAFGTFGQRYRSAKKALASWSLRSRYVYVCNSTYVRDFLWGTYRRRARIVFPGVDRRVFKPLPDRGESRHPSVAVVTRRTEAKGWSMLVATLGRLTQLRPDVQIVAISPERLVELSSLDARIAWHHPHSDDEVAEAFRSATIFFSCSRVEGFGLPVLESMAVGTPVVATDSQGVRDVLEHGRNGVLVPYGDAELAAKAIDALLCDVRRWEAYRVAGLATAQKFSWENFDRDLVSIVEEMASAYA